MEKEFRIRDTVGVRNQKGRIAHKYKTCGTYTYSMMEHTQPPQNMNLSKG
jgi:hypothetical protein